MKKSSSIKGMLIKLVIGVILLFFSGQYLQTHPAEKAAISGGITVMFDKMESRWHGMWGNNEKLVIYKHELESGFAALERQVQYNESCLELQLDKQLEEISRVLRDETLSTFEHSVLGHVAEYAQLKKVIDSGCVTLSGAA